MTLWRGLWQLFMEYWELALLVLTWLAISVVALRRRSDWKLQRFSEQVNFSLNELERTPDGQVRFAEPPGYLVGQFIARLEDRGFQKYLWTPERSLPALAEHLEQIQRFDEQLKQALELPSLYNESLGTVSDRYLYDRVRGREIPGELKRYR